MAGNVEAPPRTEREMLADIEAKLARIERFIERVLELPIVKMWLRGLKI